MLSELSEQFSHLRIRRNFPQSVRRCRICFSDIVLSIPWFSILFQG